MDRTVTYEIGEDDAVAAAKAAYRWRVARPRMVMALLALYLALIGLLGFMLGRDKVVELALATVIAPPVVLGLVVKWLVPRMARANYRQSKGLRVATDLSWDENGFAIHHAHGSLKLAWGDLAKIVPTERALLLYQSDLVYNLVPLMKLTPGQRADLLRCAVKTA